MAEKDKKHDVEDGEFDVYQFCLDNFDDSVRCDCDGCWTTDDVLNAMCSEIWEDIAYELGMLDYCDEDEEFLDEDDEDLDW
ncbi:hypothetical protein J4526_01885 [Desulfurococcaceae archaeon MEX13E-LK6-19]|nr:hypothetical protein J4526_01885 [Desulfurococcaceae archaeon MEX13E-LK6-19]